MTHARVFTTATVNVAFFARKIRCRVLPEEMIGEQEEGILFQFSGYATGVGSKCKSGSGMVSALK